jgi:hypothetical protein
MLRRAAFERALAGLLEQSAGPGRLLAPVLHLHGTGGWQHVTVNVASAAELEGSLAEARHLSELERVDAFVCVLRREHSRSVAAGLGVRADATDEIAYAAQSVYGDVANAAGLEEVREAVARLVFRRG